MSKKNAVWISHRSKSALLQRTYLFREEQFSGWCHNDKSWSRSVLCLQHL